VLAYATFSQGYKSGTYDAGANALAITNVLGEETTPPCAIRSTR